MPLLSGILAIYSVVYQVHFPLIVASLCLVILVVKERAVFRYLSLLVVFSFLFFTLLTHWVIQKNQSEFTNHSEHPLTFFGTISSNPKVDGDRISFQFKTDRKETFQIHYSIQTEEEKVRLEQLSIGSRCKIVGPLKQPLEATNFYSFDYQKYLYYQHIHWIITPSSPLQDCKVGKFSMYHTVVNIRQKGIVRVKENVPEPLAGIVVALVYGERGFIEDDVLKAYQSLGIIHLLAVSGLHVSLLVGSIYFVLLRIGITRERAIEGLLIAIPLYTIIAGAAPSVIRAGVMTMVALCCIRFKVSFHPLDGICIAGIFILLFQPFYIFHIGFQLSFFISFCLIVSASKISQYKSYLIKIIAVTILSQLCSIPIILYHFYEISLLSLPLNIIYIPFISLCILPLSFIIVVLLLTIPFLAEPIIWVLHPLIIVTHQFLLQTAELSFPTITTGRPQFIVLLSLLIAIGTTFICWEKSGKKRKMILPLSFIAAVITIQLNIPYLSSYGEITFIDVGQGDGILIELPYRKGVYLLDAGGAVSFGTDEEWKRRSRKFDVGADIVNPYLKAKGIKKIDKLILSHGHYDHIGGVESLLNNVKIKEVLYSVGPVEGEFEQLLLEKLIRSGADITFVHDGMIWREGKANFAVLSPKVEEQYTNLNNRSIVLYAKIGGKYWLFTGDLEQEGEARLQRDYPNLKVDILKAGHHGSRTSTTLEFLEMYQPKVAIISAGRSNRFGHPHDEVIQALHEKKVMIMRTDQNGAIRYRYKGDSGYFERKIGQK